MFDTLAHLQLHRLLWAHAAQQIIQTMPHVADYEVISIGYGTGLRSRSTGRTLLVHPSSNDSLAGDLALTIPGQGTQPIIRCGQNYPDYLSTVADIVETSARNYLSDTSMAASACTFSPN
jgi:hypothetical protein